jgi:hypothetical protein
MHIAIAQRLHPFSHRPNTCLLLPGSGYSVRIYPSRLEVGESHHLDLDIMGPVEDFTVMQDLEKGIIKVWGHAANGFFRYLLGLNQNGSIGFLVEKGLDRLSHPFEKLSGSELFQDRERLSLGKDRGQDWDKVISRMDMAEIIPFWYRLGRITPFKETSKGSGTTHLLTICQEIVSQRDTTKIVPALQNTLKAGFSGILCPRLIDADYQGYQLPEVLEEENSLSLLSNASQLIRRLFIQENGQELLILPALPPEFHCGRMTQIDCSFGSMDMEWSKKLLRRVHIRSRQAVELLVRLQPDIQSYRLRQGDKDRGVRVQKDKPLQLLADTHYYLDNFQK